MSFLNRPAMRLGAAALAAACFMAPAQALVLANGDYVQYDFDLSGLVDTSAPARGLLILQRYRGDILSGYDKVKLEVFYANDASRSSIPVIWTTITEWNFGPTSAWGLQMYRSSDTDRPLEPIMTSFKGSYRITALWGSVDLVEASATIRDVAFNDVTQVQFREEVPEPGTPSLLLAGVAALGWLGRKSRPALNREHRAGAQAA